MAKSGTRSLLYIIVVAALFILSFYFYLVELKLNLNLNVNLKKRSGATWKALLERLNQTEEGKVTALYQENKSKPEKLGCTPVEKIFFLKTSKTGSTSIANIVQRFGFKRPDTNFLMGESSNWGSL